MKEADLKNRVDALLSSGKEYELYQGALTLLAAVHGTGSIQVNALVKDAEQVRAKWSPGSGDREVGNLAHSALTNLKAELDAGIVGSLQRTITGEVLTDFIQLARTALEEKGDEAKKVAAVLAASVYEDTIRRLALTNGIPHTEKLSDVLTALKDNGLLQGSQVGIAVSYLNFRNNSLHAQWDKVERESVASVLGFVEQLLLKHF
jgi:hypothetical protein